VDAQKQFKEGNYQEALDLSLKAENYYQAIETIKRTPPKVTLKINGININREQAIEDLKKLHSTKTETQKTQAIQAIEETQGNTEGTLTDTIGVLYNAMNYLTNENNTHKINPDKFLIMLTKRNPFTKKAQLKNSSIADENYKINKNENKALTHIKEAIKMFGSKNLKKALQLCNEAFANGEKKPD
jgi:predicted methyltransferase